MRISQNNLSNTHLWPRIPLSVGFSYSKSGPPKIISLESMAPSRKVLRELDGAVV